MGVIASLAVFPVSWSAPEMIVVSSRVSSPPFPACISPVRRMDRNAFSMISSEDIEELGYFDVDEHDYTYLIAMQVNKRLQLRSAEKRHVSFPEKKVK